MTKPAKRSHHPYVVDACALLGSLIRESRLDRRMTVAELAERSATSRGLVNRVETGDPGCSIGAAFEMATVLRISLFSLDDDALARHLYAVRGRLTLLPKYARKTNAKVKDDF